MAKKVALGILFLMVFACKNSNAPTALEYSSKITLTSNRIGDEVQQFYNYLQDDDFENADKQRLKIITVCDSILNELTALGSYEGDKSLNLAVKEYIAMQKGLANKEFKGIIEANDTIDELNNVSGTPNVDAIAEAYVLLDQYEVEIAKKDSVYFGKAVAAQKKFALKHGFLIDEGDVDTSQYSK